MTVDCHRLSLLSWTDRLWSASDCACQSGGTPLQCTP